MAKKPKTQEELDQEAFLVSASEADNNDDEDFELDSNVEGNKNDGGTTDDNNSANNDEITDAEVDGFEASNRQEPSKVEQNEQKTDAAAKGENVPASETPPSAETKPEEIKPEEVKPQEAPAAQETPSVAASEASKEATAPQEAPESFTPEKIQQVYQDWRKETENLLADHHYALKPEELEEFEVEPNKVIARLMSRVYLDSVTAAINQITGSFPRLVSLTLEQNERDKANENVFFDRWPQLKGKDDLVRRIGANYRVQNQSATVEQFVNEVGAAAMVALRLDPNPNANANGNGQVNGNANANKPANFVPAVNTPTPLPAKQPNTNVFAQLNDEFEQEDADFS